jgi:hypothetical protein
MENLMEPLKNSRLPTNFELTDEFREAFDLIESTENSVFVTGRAGTGKSTFLEYFRENTKKTAVFLAPTGVAALNIKGKTIHSLFRFPHTVITGDAIKNNKYAGVTRQILKSVKVIVIDEISMVRADLLEGMDYILKKIRENTLPFGGAQMVFVGDMYQLPPVVSNNDKVSISYNGEIIFEGSIHHYFERKYRGYYFFNSDVFKKSVFKYYVLETVFRQRSDFKFLEILNAIREGKITDELLSKLNERHFPIIEETVEREIVLGATNSIVEELNKRKMDELPTEEFVYCAELSGVFEFLVSEKDYPVEKNLILKEGAQVMMVKNDKIGRWVNGTIGVVKSLADNSIVVDIDGTDFDVGKESWEAIDYEYDPVNDKLDTKPIGEYRQYPIKLAWAITIHKSQGKTFEKIIIDLGGGAFAHGQTYVALSRCKTLNGIRLKQPIKRKDLILDDRVVRFMAGIC